MDIEKRFKELADRADERCYTAFSEFLNMEEESVLSALKLNTPYKLFGDNCEYAEFPIRIIKIEPVSKKFADKLSHRDFLGSLMGLGIRREVLGDIVIFDNTGYLFCLESISDYIVQSLGKVRHTSVKCAAVDMLPQNALSAPEERQLIVASERLDVIAAAAYNLSRNSVKELFISRRVYINSRLCENFSYIPKEADIISIRGFGRLIYGGVLGKTKKNRLVILIKIYK